MGLLIVLGSGACRKGSDDTTEAETETSVEEVCLGAGGPGVLGIDGGRFEVHLDDEAFGFSIRDCDGTTLTQTRRDGPAAFSGLAIGMVETFDPALFYDPKLPSGDGASQGIRWFRAAELRSGDVARGETELVYTTRADDGEAGPDVTVRIGVTEVSAVLDIEVPDDERIVLTALTMAADPGEGFHGLGQHFDRLDGRGLVREMQMQAENASESGTNEVHVPVPFVLSTRRWGLFVDDRHPAAFDLARTREDAMRVTFFARGFRVHLLAHRDPLAMVEHYTALTAQPAHVPFWALGPVWWRNRNAHSDEVLSDARRARQLGFPGSLMWIDRPWQTYYQNFRFNAVQLPDYEAMFDELRALGYRALLHHSPQVNVPGTSNIAGGEDASEGLYDLYVDSGWVVTFDDGAPVRLPWGGGTAAFVDWSHPDAVAHVQGLIERVTPFGVVGTKMDWDEYLQPNFGPARLHMRFANGETNLTMKSWYSALYHAAIKEGFEGAIGEPSFQLVRHGSPRDQQWSTCVWPGDLDNDFTEHTRGPSEHQQEWNVGGLPAAIVANQSLGLSGFPCFASDIGGYRNGQPEAEALLRWTAFGVFNAVMQVGGGGRTHMPWSEDTPYPLPDEGWPAGLSSIDDMLDITRRYFRLRMDLVPYIHNELLAAQTSGRPLVRSLWSMHPDDPEARRFERDFYFGPFILVAPVYEPGATERTLYLPEGEWVDLWTGERHQGPRTLVRAAPLHEIPAFLRDGAIVPLAAPDIDSLLPAAADDVVAYADRPLTRLWVVPGRAGTLRLFNGLDVETTTETEPDLFTVAVTLGQPSPTVDERIRFAPEAVEVRIETRGTTLDGGVSVRLVRDGGGAELGPLGDSAEGWTTEQDGRVVVVRIEADATIEVSPRP